MDPLNLPAIAPRIRRGEASRDEIWDPIRKRFVSLTPEEWVRQHLINYLIIDRHVPASHIGVECAIRVNGMPRRCDVVVFNKLGNPLLLVECKAPAIPVTQEVFDQVARYNLTVGSPYLMVTNGYTHVVSQIDHHTRSWRFLPLLPLYPDMC